PKMDGISVLESWRRAGRAMPVLMLTARDRWSDKVQGFDAGADDYVAKPFHLEEVLARIRALLRRSAGHAKSELNCGPVRLDTRTGRVTVDGNPVKLTSHEYRLLAYLMHHTGRVVSSLYRAAVERAFDRRLNVYLRTLVADVATPDEAGERFPQSLGEPLFELPLSGWYWQVTRLDTARAEVRSSRSLWDSTLPHLGNLGVSAGPGGARQGYVDGPEDQRLRLVERVIDLGDEGRFLVAVAGDAAEIDEETRGFDRA